MTPIGHAAASLLVAGALRVPALPLVVAGVAPDVDFLLVAHPGFNEWHRVITHNVFFVLVMATLIAAFYRGSARLFLGAALAGALHLGCDAVLDANASNGFGVAVLWPLSNTMWSPFNLMQSWSTDNPAGWADPAASIVPALVSSAFELPLWAAAWYVARRRRP